MRCHAGFCFQCQYYRAHGRALDFGESAGEDTFFLHQFYLIVRDEVR